MADEASVGAASIAAPEGVAQLEMTQGETGKEKCVKIGCGLSALLYIGAVATAGATLVYAAGGVSLILAPYIVYQRKKLTDLEAVKATLDFMGDQTKEFEKNNENLKKQVNELGNTTDKLEEHERALDMITATQGQNIDMLEGQVKDNKKLAKQMEKNLTTIVLQNLLTVIINNDTDGDFKIDDDELPTMIEQLSQVNGVTLNAENFKSAVQSTGGDINAVMDIIRGLLAAEKPDPDKAVFIIHLPEESDDEDGSTEAAEETKDDDESPLVDKGD